MTKTAFLFAGQGAQYPGMGQTLYETSPAARAVFDMGERLRPGTLAMCFSGDAATLSLTENTQPCLFLVDLACARAAVEAGATADCAAGFSLGEIAALAFCGVLSDEDAFRLVCRRGEIMAACAAATPGGMAAVLKLTDEQVERVSAGFAQVYPVNYNAPGQIACAGAADEMDAFAAAVKQAGGRALKLHVSGAFHTPFMAEAARVLGDVLEGMEIHAPAIPLYANRTAAPYPADRAGIVTLIREQVMSPVLWRQTLEAMHRERGVDTYLEVGAGKTLTGLVGRTLPEATALYLAEAEDVASLTARIM